MEQRQDNDNQAQKLDLNDVQKQKLLALYNNLKVFQRIFASWFPESHVMNNRIVDLTYIRFIMQEIYKFVQQVLNVVNNVNINIPEKDEYEQYINYILDQAMNELNNEKDVGINNIEEVQSKYNRLQNEFDNLFNSENQDPEMQIKMIKQFCIKVQEVIKNGNYIPQQQQNLYNYPKEESQIKHQIQKKPNPYIQQQQQNQYNYPKEESQIKHQIQQQQQQQNLYNYPKEESQIKHQIQKKPNPYIQQQQQNQYIPQQKQKEQEQKLAKQNNKTTCYSRCQIF